MTLAIPRRLYRSPLTALTRRLAVRAVSGLRAGRLTVDFPDGTTRVFGPPDAPRSAHIRIHDDEFFNRVVLHGEIGFGEAYMDGLWSSPNLVELIELAIVARRDVGGLLRRLALPAYLRNLWGHRRRRNTVDRSRENIHEHYDLGNDFFRLWLDETMTYSCALFERPEATLEEAQLAKYRALAERVGLRPGDRVLEIGTGWGGMAALMAREYEAHVTTITVSEEQWRLARERMAREGLADRVDVQLLDYRRVRGPYDKIVSIEMFEAVGYEYFETFFKTCDAALRPGGRLGMQVIVVPDRIFPAQRRGVNWLQKHIFPGGLLPSIGAIERALAPTSLLLTAVHDIGPHYTRTLRQWRERFFQRLDDVRGLGFTDVFIRKWEYYLAGCEAAFQVRHISDVQLVMEKPGA